MASIDLLKIFSINHTKTRLNLFFDKLEAIKRFYVFLICADFANFYCQATLWDAILWGKRRVQSIFQIKR